MPLTCCTDEAIADVAHCKLITTHKLKDFPLYLQQHMPHLFKDVLTKSTTKSDIYRPGLVLSDLANVIFQTTSSLAKPPGESVHLANLLKIPQDSLHWDYIPTIESSLFDIPLHQKAIALTGNWEKLSFLLRPDVPSVTLPSEVLFPGVKLSRIPDSNMKTFHSVQSRHMIWQVLLTFNIRKLPQFDASNVFQNYVKEMTVAYRFNIQHLLNEFAIAVMQIRKAALKHLSCRDAVVLQQLIHGSLYGNSWFGAAIEDFKARCAKDTKFRLFRNFDRQFRNFDRQFPFSPSRARSPHKHSKESRRTLRSPLKPFAHHSHKKQPFRGKRLRSSTSRTKSSTSKIHATKASRTFAKSPFYSAKDASRQF